MHRFLPVLSNIAERVNRDGHVNENVSVGNTTMAITCAALQVRSCSCTDPDSTVSPRTLHYTSTSKHMLVQAQNIEAHTT